MLNVVHLSLTRLLYDADLDHTYLAQNIYNRIIQFSESVWSNAEAHIIQQVVRFDEKEEYYFDTPTKGRILN